MRIIFQGTPAIASSVLQALIANNSNIVACYTQPDRAKGRGQQLEQSPVKILAQAHNIPVCQPENFKDPATIEELREFKPDIIVVLAYGLILPTKVLALAPYGCINIHASLLPHWRGASPISQAILAGDSVTGISLMQMDKGMDTGAIISQTSLTLTGQETTASLTDGLAQLAQSEVVKLLATLAQEHHLSSQAQDASLASYAPKMHKTDALIDWKLPVAIIERQIRAYNPWPVAFSYINKENIKIWQAKINPEQSMQAPGTIIKVNKEGVFVATGAGVLQITALQFPSKNILTAKDFANYKKLSGAAKFKSEE